ARAATIASASPADLRTATHAVVTTVRIHDGRIEVDCAAAAIAELLQATLAPHAPATVTVVSDVRLTRSGRVMRLVQASGAGVTPAGNASLVQLVLKARRWWDMLRGNELDITMLAAREGVQPAYVTRVLRLAFLAPSVVEAILGSTIRSGVDGTVLTATGAIPTLWSEQVGALLPRTVVA
ncbi:hypothetical protein IFT55_16970, partial [Sphingomonas sp. CFBP 13720]|nr:hypothetical protein [Sphingomonas sp. CFBP 13720]